MVTADHTSEGGMINVLQLQRPVTRAKFRRCYVGGGGGLKNTFPCTFARLKVAARVVEG